MLKLEVLVDIMKEDSMTELVLEVKTNSCSYMKRKQILHLPVLCSLFYSGLKEKNLRIDVCLCGYVVYFIKKNAVTY